MAANAPTMKKTFGSQSFRVLAGFVVIFACGCSKPPPSVLTLTPAAMNPTGGMTAPRTGEVTFWANGTLQSKLHLEAGSVTITIRARGNVVEGQAPILSVDLQKQPVGKLTINDRQYKDYTLTTKLPSTGTTTLGISFANQLVKPQPLLNRWVIVESVTVQNGA